MKRVMLYFGSFNPCTRATSHWPNTSSTGSCATRSYSSYRPKAPTRRPGSWLPNWTVSRWPRSPAPPRNTPSRIKPSVVEFLLPKPSYTIDTLRYLEENHGAQMRFSILMGGDQIARLDRWKEYERILEYPVYVYPRRGPTPRALPTARRCSRTPRCRSSPQRRSATASGWART